MVDILRTISSSRGRFQPATPNEYVGLQIARKLSDLPHVREYVILLEHYPAELVIRAFQETAQGERPERDSFLFHFRKITNQTTNEDDDPDCY
ncbi:MAG: hypothetical protein H0U76_13440 [Ktedonobacteraceae bacterium]|nr:hypothetical protein [Ktedonobacteraceae bacterium]